MSNNYDFTTYSNLFDALSDEERITHITNFCCDNFLNELQADVIAKHLEKFTDDAFRSFFKSSLQRIADMYKHGNIELLVPRFKTRVTSLAVINTPKRLNSHARRGTR